MWSHTISPQLFVLAGGLGHARTGADLRGTRKGPLPDERRICLAACI